MPAGSWSAGWPVGSWVEAAEFKKGIGAIYDTTLTGAAASIDITGIIATYAHLLIVLSGRGDTAALLVTGAMRFNNNSAAAYNSQYLRGAAAVASAGEVLAATSFSAYQMPGASAAAGHFGHSEILIPNYASATPVKTFSSRSFAQRGGASGDLFIETYGGFWNATDVINRVTLLPGTGNFAIGTRATVYGMGA